ncbi:MAG: glycogen synthase GlgA [Clostridiaceae bacterium]|nr:glycogen synthase GlgA [Clostridiaceae bacterium]
MKLLYAASEAAPFCKTGGLADVAGALPKALAASGVEVSVVLPLYDAVPDWARREMTFVRMLQVSLAWRNQTCGVFSLVRDGVTYYFLDNGYYYRRRELYGHYDDGERFAFFSKAIVDMIPALGLSFDVIHANDWQTALIPVYLKCLYRDDPRYQGIRTVFTIHNIAYQGSFPRGFLSDVAGIDDAYFRSGLLAYNDGINLLKSAIVLCDALTTVSPTYAREILTAYYGAGLDGILRANAGKLCGILNGIDTDVYNPARDEALSVPYSAGSPEGKQENKLALQRTLGLHADLDVPVIALVTRLAEHKGIDLIAAVLDDIMSENIQLVVLGRGEWKYEQLFQQAKRRYPGKISVNILFSEDFAHKIYAGADMLLMPSKSEPCGLAQMVALRYGTLPIVRETGGLADTVHAYNPATGEGNGFSFTNYNAHDMLYTIRLAASLYHDREVWNTLVRRGMSEDFSWKRSAKAFEELYERIAEKK